MLHWSLYFSKRLTKHSCTMFLRLRIENCPQPSSMIGPNNINPSWTLTQSSCLGYVKGDYAILKILVQKFRLSTSMLFSCRQYTSNIISVRIVHGIIVLYDYLDFWKKDMLRDMVTLKEQHWIHLGLNSWQYYCRFQFVWRGISKVFLNEGCESKGCFGGYLLTKGCITP